MKHFFTGLSLAIALLFSSCRNNSAVNITSDGATQSLKTNLSYTSKKTGNQISFKVDKKTVTSSCWNISRSLMNEQVVLNVTSNMHEDTRTVNLNVNGALPGRYKFGAGGYNKPGYAYGSYFGDYNAAMTDACSFQKGEFIITAIDTVRGILDAEFSAIVKSAKGETLTITDGKISKGKLKLGIARY